MGDIMRKTIGIFVTIALAACASAGEVSGADAQDYWRHPGGGWHGNGWQNGGEAFVGGVVAGGPVGSAIAAPSYGYAPGYYDAGPTVIYVQPPPRVIYVQPQPQVVYVQPRPRVYVEQPALVPPALVPTVGPEPYPDY